MQYALLGFSQEASVRNFCFQGVTADAKRVRFHVSVDLSLARRCAVPVQDLPQVCSRVLQARPDDAPTRRLSVTELDLHDAAFRNAEVAAELAAAQSARSKSASRAAALRAARAITAGDEPQEES